VFTTHSATCYPNMMMSLLVRGWKFAVLIMFTSMSNAVELSPQMPLSYFISMLFTEATSELFGTEDGEKMWWQLTMEYWNDPPSKWIPQSYILCNSTPEKSSFERRIMLEDKIQALINSNNLIFNERNIVIDFLPLYNTDENTCFFASLPWMLARDLGKKSCYQNHTNCVIQPLLPVMKLSQGTVATAGDLEIGQQSLVMYVKLSPFGETQEQTYWRGLVGTAMATAEISDEECLEVLRLALPASATTVECSNNHEISEFVTAEDIGDGIVTFTIDLREMEQKLLYDSILVFISGLAVIPIVQSIDVVRYRLVRVYNDKPSNDAD
jgi:hypothetical protein